MKKSDFKKLKKGDMLVVRNNTTQHGFTIDSEIVVLDFPVSTEHIENNYPKLKREDWQYCKPIEFSDDDVSDDYTDWDGCWFVKYSEVELVKEKV